MERILECVPNFSEGRNKDVINAITGEISRVSGVKVLDVDMGATTNRTVVTFAGEPEAVVEAAFRAIAKASSLIDMRTHKGAHPRIGATDVCPLVPVRGISVEEAVKMAHELGRRVGEELGIPVYMYEFAATSPERKSLAAIRAGEYESLPQKLRDPKWKPDYGPSSWSDSIARTGATVIGVRKFLIAYNINLNTKSVRLANRIAFDLRERGRLLRHPDPLTGNPLKNYRGEEVWQNGIFPTLRAIGWYIDEYGIAQVSINITDVDRTPLHIVFEEASRRAEMIGVRVTGSEIVGLVPLKPILDAGEYFLKKQKRTTGIPDEDIIHIAIESLGLNSTSPFDPKKKIIEYLLEEEGPHYLNAPLISYINDVIRDKVVPGGGSVAGLVFLLGVALAGMAVNVSAAKRGNEEKYELYEEISSRLAEIFRSSLSLPDDDVKNFKKGMELFREDPERAVSLLVKTPSLICNLAGEITPLLFQVENHGMKEALSDTGTSAALLYAGIYGAVLNMLINVVNSETPGHLKEEIFKKIHDAIAHMSAIHKVMDRVLAHLMNELKQSSGV